MTKKFFLASATGVVVFGCLRTVVLIPQLAHTPYRDATLGADVIKVIVLGTPIWIIIVTIFAFLVAWWACGRNRGVGHEKV